MTVPFNYDAPVNFNIPAQAPAGLDPRVEAALSPIYQGLQQIIQALVNNCGIGPQVRDTWPSIVSAGSAATVLASNMGRFYCTALENIQLGALGSFILDAGIIKVRNANATNNTRPAQCFCTTPGGMTAGSVGEVTVISGLISISGLTPGTRYFLSTTNGLVTSAAPVAAGNIEQYIGVALTSNQLAANFGYWIQH